MPPAVGQTTPDFSLNSLEGRPTKVSAVLAEGPVALLVLRGFAGYQCPLCNRQVQDLIQRAEGFATDKKLPAHFTLVLDPDYAFTKRCDLRWEAKNETAYPSAFLIDRAGKITFAKISNSHGGRSSAKERLTAAAPR